MALACSSNGKIDQALAHFVCDFSQVDEIRETGDEEFKKRCQVEKALRQAASIFKKELHEKNEELGILNGQLRSMQDNPFSKAVPMIDGNQV